MELLLCKTIQLLFKLQSKPNEEITFYYVSYGGLLFCR